MENKYLEEVKKIVLDFLKDENVKIFLFGSRARDDFSPSSDVDIGIIPKDKFNKIKLTLLKEYLENSNVPYKVEIVDFSNLSDSFKEEALKDAIIWKG